MKKLNKHKGSTFESFLEEEEIFEEVNIAAIKEVIAYAVKKSMIEKNLSKTKVAEMMKTSRSQLDRLLDPDNVSITLSTLIKAVQFTKKKLTITIKN